MHQTLIGELVPEHPRHQPLCEFTTPDLINELKRRAVGCLIVTVQVAEFNQDRWHFALKGSTNLRAAMGRGLSQAMQAAPNDNDDPHNCHVPA